jgi:hypothetical protein
VRSGAVLSGDMLPDRSSLEISWQVPVVAKSAEAAGEHLGWLTHFAGRDMPASCAFTQQRLGWHPAGVGLISDLDQARDFQS